MRLALLWAAGAVDQGNILPCKSQPLNHHTRHTDTTTGLSAFPNKQHKLGTRCLVACACVCKAHRHCCQVLIQNQALGQSKCTLGWTQGRCQTEFGQYTYTDHVFCPYATATTKHAHMQ